MLLKEKKICFFLVVFLLVSMTRILGQGGVQLEDIKSEYKARNFGNVYDKAYGYCIDQLSAGTSLEPYTLYRIVWRVGAAARMERKYSEADTLFSKAIKYFDGIESEEKLYWMSRLYEEKGQVYKDSRKYFVARDYLRHSLSLINEYIENRSERKAWFRKIRTLHFLGILNYSVGNYFEAEKNCSESKDLAIKHGELSYFTYTLLYLASTYEKQERYEEAIAQTEELIQYINTKTPDRKDQYALALETKGTIYYHQKKYQEALQVFKEEIEIESKLSKTPAETYYAWLNAGACCVRLGKYEQAKYYLDYAHNDIGINNERPHLREGLKSDRSALSVLYFQNINELDAFRATKEPEHLDNAIIYANTAIRLLEETKNNLNRKIARQRLLHDFYGIVVQAVETYQVAYEHYGDPKWKHEALATTERMRALQLKTARQQARAWKDSEVPDSLLELRQHYWEELIAIENGTTTLDQSTRSVLDLREQFNQLQDQLAQDYPTYFSLEQANVPMPLKEVQALLEPEESVVYFVGEGDWYFAFVITSEALYLHPYEDLPDLATDVSDWRELIQQGKQPVGDSLRRQTLYMGHKIYQTIWEPIEEQVTEKVYLIPDGALWALPFDAILTERPNEEALWSDQPYLLHRHRISYLTDLQQLGSKSSNHPNRILAIAPDFSQTLGQLADPERRGSWEALQHNTREVKQIVEQVRSKQLLGTKATKQNFLTAAPDYGVLHLATHATAGRPDAPAGYLVFGDVQDTLEELLVSELYSQQFNADMIVLSACETAEGLMQHGEGMISLAHASQYAGAKSVITSLWQVNDLAATELMTDFYAQLKAGQEKDVALQNTKKAYINANDNPRAHPYYWANFVAYGDPGSIAFAREGENLWWALGLAVLVGGTSVLYAKYQAAKRKNHA